MTARAWNAASRGIGASASDYPALMDGPSPFPGIIGSVARR